MTRSHNSKSMSTGLVSRRMMSFDIRAALLKRKSKRPKCFTVPATRLATDATSPASKRMAIAAAPSSSASVSACDALMSPMLTRQPSATNRRHAAAPIPEAPPVTMTTLSFSPFIRALLRRYGDVQRGSLGSRILHVHFILEIARRAYGQALALHPFDRTLEL